MNNFEGPKVPCLFILMERANAGNLEDFIEIQFNQEPGPKERKKSVDRTWPNSASINGGIGYNQKGRRVNFLTVSVIKAFFLDICQGLAHLHEHGVIHRDLVCFKMIANLSTETSEFTTKLQ